MNAEEYYNSKAIKHQLKRAIKHDHKYFKDAIIEMLEDYHQSQLKLLGLHGVVVSEAEGCFECKHLFSKNDYCSGNSVDCGKYEKQP